MGWVSVKDNKPQKEGKYLCVSDYYGQFIKVCSYSKDLYKVDDCDFVDKKKKDGFYNYDSEWGYFEETNITHWQDLPELPPKE